MRTLPAETDRYAYDIDGIRLGERGMDGPTLRTILLAATEIGNDEGVHDDEARAQEFAETCETFHRHLQRYRHLKVTVHEARLLFDACMSAWSYADQNNYGAESEENEEFRLFAQHGEFMLRALTRPWAMLAYKDDGSHGFWKVTN
jgi:hypothetical protein